jgi:uncharacterized protein
MTSLPKSAEKNVKKVVVDTNVIISAALHHEGNPSSVFEHILSGKVVNYSSREILHELFRVIQKRQIVPKLSGQQWATLLTQYVHASLFVDPVVAFSVITEDPSDDKFINCAVTAGADFIITGDAHLLSRKEFHGVRMVTPKEFLQIMSS